MGSKRLLAAVRKQDLPFLRQLCARPDVFCLDLDRPLGRAGCVVMASGLGRRFGGNKLLAPLGGRPLLSYVLASTDGLFARRVVVTRNPDTAALCRQQGIQTVLHSLPGRSDTIRLGLEAATAEGTLDGCLFCPGDQPLLRRETAAALALCGAAVPDKIWRTAWQGTPGAPVWFPAWSFGELAALSQDQGGGWVLRRHPEQVGLVEASSSAELADVDTREDLQRMQSGYME
ncbi:MAG TPA: nucleotidyltransferase family protein [Candidatus Faecalibacterium avium]|nr:nucleotidyltransferase family protein [Candidatus Faecalibacterium avium]